MRSACALAVLACTLSQTAAAAPPASVPVELTIVGGTQLNPNAQGRASPVVVRVFELTSASAFDAADFAAIFDHPSDALSRQIVKQEEMILRPGDIQKHDRELSSQVALLGIAAAFRDIDHAIWHVTVSVEPGRRNILLVDLDHDAIRLVPVESSP